MRTTPSFCYIGLVRITRVKRKERLFIFSTSNSDAMGNTVQKVQPCTFYTAIFQNRNTISKPCMSWRTHLVLSAMPSPPALPLAIEKGRDSRSGNHLGFQFAGLQDNQFLARRIQSYSMSQLPEAASLPPARSASESLTFTEKRHQGKQKIANQICKAFHILLMSRYHKL